MNDSEGDSNRSKTCKVDQPVVIDLKLIGSALLILFHRPVHIVQQREQRGEIVEIKCAITL